MTTLRNFFLATAFAAALPAMAASPPPVIIDFEKVAVPAVITGSDFDSNGDPVVIYMPKTGGGQPVGAQYSDVGVTFDSNAYVFYAPGLNAAPGLGQNVANLLPGADGAPGLVVMAAFQMPQQDCIDKPLYPAGCPRSSSVSTTATLSPSLYKSVEFSYSSDTTVGVNFGFVSAAGIKSWEHRDLTSNSTNSDISTHWDTWTLSPFTAPGDSTLTFIEFSAQEGHAFFDNIVLTPLPPAIPTPEPSTYALTLLGLVGIRFLAVRRRRSN